MQLNRASLAVAALLAGVLSTPVHAADAEADDAAQPTGWDWTGFYAGLGVSVGEVRAVPDTLEGVAIIDGVEFSSEVGA